MYNKAHLSSRTPHIVSLLLKIICIISYRSSKCISMTVISICTIAVLLNLIFFVKPILYYT